jgi:hypothetical protein
MFQILEVMKGYNPMTDQTDKKVFNPDVLKKAYSETHQSENAFGEIVLQFENGFIFHDNAKRARKWLRDNRLTVKHAIKKTHAGRVWVFSGKCPQTDITPLSELSNAVKYFTGKYSK